MAVDAWTYADFVALWRSLFPDDYTQPIETELDGEGFDIVSAYAAIMARVEEASRFTFERYYCEPHTLQRGEPAAGASVASGKVSILRAPPVDQPLELVAGTRLRETYVDTVGVTRLGDAYELAEAVSFSTGVRGPIEADVLSVRREYAANAPAGALSVFDELGTREIGEATVDASSLTTVANAGGLDRFSEADVGRFLVFSTGPNAGVLARVEAVDVALQSVEVDRALVAGTGNADLLELAELGLTVTNSAAITGGRTAWLDAIGADRLVRRTLGEDDEAYRRRVCRLPDIVSPDAIERIVRSILDPAGVPFAIKETRNPASWPGFRYDIDPYDVLGDFEGYVGGCEEVSAFVVCVRPDNGLGDFGLTFDEAPTGGGSAWDTVAYDGASIGYRSLMASLYDAVEAARAAGVCWELVADPALIPSTGGVLWIDPAWSPARLDPFGWWDAGQLAGYSDGDAVSLFPNFGVGGPLGDLAQATAAARPLYVASDVAFNGLPSVAFDGVDHRLQGVLDPWAGLDPGEEGTLVVVLRRTTSSVATAFGTDEVGFPGMRVDATTSGVGTSEIRDLVGATLNPTLPAQPVGPAYILALRLTRDSVVDTGSASLDGVAGVNDTLPAGGLLGQNFAGQIPTMGSAGASNYMAGAIQQVLFWKRRLSEAERLTLVAYLNDRAGTSSV